MIIEITNSYCFALNYLRRMVVDVPDERMTEQAGGVVNHPAWVIGHLAFSCQKLAGEMGLHAWLMDNWEKRFGTGSVPTVERKQYPSKTELLEILADAQRRVLDRLRAVGEEGLKKPLPDVHHRVLFPTLGHAILHILTVHAALHVGQVTVWRRAVGLGPLREVFV